jgi:hypothetical protein
MVVMTMTYTVKDGLYCKSRREKEQPGIELQRCADNLWRTAEEKAKFDESAAIAAGVMGYLA